jgi:ferredoxin
MRLVVDMNKCQGYAQCAFHAPGTFAMHGDEVLVYDPSPSADGRLDLRQAQAACPTQAILLTEDDQVVPAQRGAREDARSQP